MIVAKSHISALIEPVAVGGGALAVAIFMPWLGPAARWPDIGLRIWFCLCGLVFVWAGISVWRPRGIGLVLTPDGMQWYGAARLFGPKVSPWRWDEILRARFVEWRDEYDDRECGILIELADDARHPWGAKHAKWVREQLEQRFGQLISAKAVLLEDDKWEWNAEEVAGWINESVSRPETRARWAGE